MIIKEITTSVRSTFGKGPVNRMRAGGKTPGVVYSGGKEAIPLEFETKDLFSRVARYTGPKCGDHPEG